MFSFLATRPRELYCLMLSSKLLLHNCLDNTVWKEFFRTTFVGREQGSNQLWGKNATDVDHSLKIVENFKGRHFYILYKRKYMLDFVDKSGMQPVIAKRRPRFSAKDNTVTLFWQYRCPLSWYDLAPMPGTTWTRQCTACDTTVAKTDVDELMKSGSVGLTCAAVLVSHAGSVGDIEVSVSSPPSIYDPIYTAGIMVSDYGYDTGWDMP
eukprot:TRINITY_DN62134_c0_g1_i3.p1 TRINITY_DN62134_c0_g1~~TRINITY_DN62134_c0_g1_i3.p1  ORF type:complete len:209 (+),score=16.31 TRINITY_DN62134_c0_g1_i3:312-938(+)